jgi:hypothetical protein
VIALTNHERRATRKESALLHVKRLIGQGNLSFLDIQLLTAPKLALIGFVFSCSSERNIVIIPFFINTYAHFEFLKLALFFQPSIKFEPQIPMAQVNTDERRKGKIINHN